MTAYWTHFAAAGSPSSPSLPRWSAFDPVDQPMQSLAPPQPQVESDFAAVHHCAFWSLAG